MMSWKRKAALVVVGVATATTVGMSTPASAASSWTGTVFYADPTLIQIAGSDGVMEFFYFDDQTLFNDGLSIEALEGKQVILVVDANGVVDAVDDATLSGQPKGYPQKF